MDKNTSLNQGMNTDLETEVAIIGAGAAGLYSAYRLTKDKKYEAKDVQVFEMNAKIGGRLESIVMPGMRFWGELGGMRYLTSQEIITTLVEGYPLTEKNQKKRTPLLKGKMTSIPFSMGSPKQLLFYLRKTHYKQDAWDTAQRHNEKLLTRYYLNEKDIGYNAHQLFNKIIYNVLMADPWFVENYSSKVSHGPEYYDYKFFLTSQEWDTIKPKLTYHFEKSPYNGRRVNDIGFRNLIKDQVSQEGYEFLASAGGYYSNTINWNSSEAFPYMVGNFSENSVYKTIEEGFDSIAYGLANSYMEQNGACIWSQNKLLSFTKEHSKQQTRAYQLTFLNLNSNKEWKVYANKIILAMPRRSLELLDQENFFFNGIQNPELKNNIRSVIRQPAFKILMGFEQPWWKNIGIDAGYSITDLPIRKCYYFGTDSETNNAMLLGSYNDMETETFWKALTEDEVMFTPQPHQFASSSELMKLNTMQATKMMVEEVMHQLRELHGDLVKIPEPYVTYFKDWTKDPFGAGFHAWKTGISVKQIMPQMRQPNCEENIHIVGEAYSDKQGWVEGAFCEAEKMLQEHFGLKHPHWLSKDYYLGW